MLSRLEILTYRFLRKQSEPHILVFLKIFWSPGEIELWLSMPRYPSPYWVSRGPLCVPMQSYFPQILVWAERLKRWRYNITPEQAAGEFFLFLYKERKPNFENRLWGRKDAHPTNSSLILGLPCTGTEKLSSYEVHSSVAKVYVHVSM